MRLGLGMGGRTVVLASLALCASAATAQVTLERPLLPDTVASFDQAFAAWQKRHGVKQASLAVAYRGRLVHVGGYGGMSGAERVHIASLSKAITAVCAAHLVDGGKLRFTTTLGEIMGPALARLGPPADARLAAVTIEQLIAHRGGIGSRAGDPATGGNLQAQLRKRPAQRVEANDMLPSVIKAKLGLPPGGAFAYSNAGYLMLGAAIEAASGQPYRDYCWRHVLAPAGIAEAGFATDWKMMGPYGGWQLSGAEYLAFYRALEPGAKGVLGPQARAWNQAGAGRALPNKPDIHYGLGLNLRRRGEEWTWWHTGSWSWDQRDAAGGRLQTSFGTLAVRSEFGASWFVYYAPLPSDEARAQLDRDLWQAARAVKKWPSDDKFAQYGVR